ncbi:hypothetical protein BC828DRAFT_136876 [Blastocladiella britannica]|nr:hypothetical protein BC828DRAFT_136876 [Blastocladiella britannica]
MVQQGATDRWWIQARITPLWVTFQVVIIILAITGVSVWSVYTAFHDPSKLQTRASSAMQTSSYKGSSAHDKSTGSNGAETHYASHAGSSQDHKSASHMQSSATVTATATTSMANTTLTTPHSAHQPMVPGSTLPAAPITVSSLQQQLTLTFAVLSFVVIACYIVHLIVILLIEDRLPLIQGILVQLHPQHGLGDRAVVRHAIAVECSPSKVIWLRFFLRAYSGSQVPSSTSSNK